MCNALTVTKEKAPRCRSAFVNEYSTALYCLLSTRQIIALWSHRVKALITVTTVRQKCGIFCCKMPLATSSGKQKNLLVAQLIRFFLVARC